MSRAEQTRALVDPKELSDEETRRLIDAVIRRHIESLKLLAEH